MAQTIAITLLRISESCQLDFDETHQAREDALRLSRDIVRNSANSIRATHREDFTSARKLLQKVSTLKLEIEKRLTNHPSIYYAGYVEDAVKEYAEAMITLAIVEGNSLPSPKDLGIGPAPYLNGLAEVVGELRRVILDSLRKDDVSRCEEFLAVMDEIYSILVTMDFPDAVTKGLRRATDIARSILERTRGDLTLALRQHRFEQKLEAKETSLDTGAR